MATTQEEKIKQLNKKIKIAIKVGNLIDVIIMIFLLLIGMYIIYSIYSDIQFQNHGQNLVEYHNFDKLIDSNPDTVAWLKMDETHINHPVMQGKDNFEYLDKDFYGDHYTAGSLFLDYENQRDFNDNYNIIHGHHMSSGAMFGDLERYTNKKFFYKNKTGKLMTPNYDYDLEVFAVSIVNAYESAVYNVKNSAESVYEYANKTAKNKRDIKIGKDDKILVLSTCSGQMNENRIVVFCKMYNEKDHL